ncbi:MAG: pyridoxal phosphate-dependent aminotransferase [Clostridia bacterium]|nr:pyridoxal phosphate-dependent aminotransferase [Clostridia bacterium]
MASLGKVRSVIRDIFEYGNSRRREIGAENVYDFSLGNPSVPAPLEVDDAIKDLLDNFGSTALHGYTSAVGDESVRSAIADDINKRFGAGVTKDDIYMTCGAAASLTVSLGAVVNDGDEVVVIAPFFPEYRVFAEAAGAKLVVVPADTESFQVDLAAIESALTPKTKAVIINTPNNPTGVVIKKDRLSALCDILRKKEAEFGSSIFLISDEPYRELVYDADTEVPYVINEYDDTIVCYSFSKSLSLPGERIGYIVVSNRIKDNREVYAAVCGAGRALGFVCAPSTMQRVVSRCLGKTSDISVYKLNRDLLYDNLSSYGYECVYPDGAFYLFVKAPEEDACAFCERAKKYELLLVPSDSFGCPGYVRISYCVSTDMIKRSLPAFKALIEEYR